MTMKLLNGTTTKKKRMSKPLPLKQRTSSVDARRDYNAETWYSVLGLLKVREYIITVDHFSIWRRHLAWAMENGKSLRDHMTQRYSSSMVFMSLLLSTELNILFNSSVITTNMRQSLQNEEYWRVEFWIGITIIFSAVLTLLGLISTYTAWSMVSCVDPSNAHCVFRSSIGQYVAELPGRLIVGSIYTFLLWVMMFFFVLLPIGYWSIALAIVSFLLFAHTICVLSAFGRIIMHSGAMGHEKIFEQNYERGLLPHSLHAHLLAKARANLSKNTSILRQYRGQSRPIDGMIFSDEEEEADLSDSYRSYQPQPYHRQSQDGDSITQALTERTSFDTGYGYTDGYRDSSMGSYASKGSSNNNNPYYYDDDGPPPSSEPRRRADSTVRFADEVDMVTSSARKNDTSNPQTSDSMIPEVDTPVSTRSSPGSAFESKSATAKHPSETLRPGVVRRDRSNTTATDGDFEEMMMFGNKTPRRSPPPPIPKVPVPARAGSEGSNNPQDLRVSTARPPIDATRSYSNPDRRPTHPGLSVLENAAKLQRQWRNSYPGPGERGLPPPSPPSRRPLRSQSPVESEASLQQLWVSSSPQNIADVRKDYPVQQQHQQPTTRISPVNGAPPQTSNYRAKTRMESPPPPPPPLPPDITTTMTPVSSSGALSSGGDTNAGTSLSEEEEEAFARDYGFDAEDPWPQSTETASLLHGPDRISQSYMSVGDTNDPTTRQRHG